MIDFLLSLSLWALREVLRGYTKQVIEEARPLQRQGRVPVMGVEWLNRFQVLARNARLDAVNTELPGVMWFVLLPGAMGCLLFCPFLPIEDARFQTIRIS